MEKVYVMDNRGRETEGFKVRYFAYNEASYFIYTLGEIDKDEYVKLYLKKMVDGEEQTITENEWSEIKGIIQKVVKEIRNQTTYSFQDLDMSNVNELMENDTRIFKLKKNIVEELIYEEPKIEVSEKQESMERPKEVVEELAKETSDPFIESLEDTLKTTFTDDIPKQTFKIETPALEEKIKPIVVGSVSNRQEKEKMEALEKELQEYKIIAYKLKEENAILKKKLIEYRERLNQVKNITKDI